MISGKKSTAAEKQTEGIEKMNSKKKLLASVVGFFVGASGSVLAQEGGAAESDGFVLEEVVVTASRRETSLSDAAISVAAISGEDIRRRNLSEMNDYLRTVPGASFVEVGVGGNAIVVRGIGIDPQNEGIISSPAAGVYFGEVSLAGLSFVGGSSDLKMIDLERVEVLRGPQGTLFGSGALAGAVRNIPNSPDLEVMEGSVKASYSNTSQSGGDNTKFEGVVNIPVIENILAVRAVAYRHDTSGYIDNIAGTVLANNGEVFPGISADTSINGTGIPGFSGYGGAGLYQNESDIGSTEHTGGRIAILWAPIENLEVNLTHIYQDVEQSGQPYVELNAGSDYEQVTFQFGDGEGVAGKESGYTDETNITNLLIDYDLDWVSLLSSTTWLDQESARNQDQSSFGGFPLAQIGESSGDIFSQELRMVSKLEGGLQYVVGIYYEEVESQNSAVTWGLTDEVVVAFGAPAGLGSRLIVDASQDKPTDQLSYYGELSYDINEQFELTLGMRQFDYERGTRDVSVGLENFDVPRETDESGNSFKANLSYRPDEDTLIYAQWSEGFRLGNTVFPVIDSICDVDADGVLDGTGTQLTEGFDSDTTENFELGVKSRLLNDRLQISGAVYQIDWMDIPITVFGGTLPGFENTCSVVANAGEARSQGVELEAIYQLSENLRLSLGSAFIDAELTKDAPGIGGVEGDRLPNSPDYNVSLGLQYGFELAGYTSYINGDYAYVSESYNKLGEKGVEIGDYGQLNMSVGIEFNSFVVEIFGNNLTDENALTHADTVVGDNRAYQLRPRTIGLNAIYQF